MKFPSFLQSLLTDYYRWTVWVLVVLVMVGGYFLVLDTKISNLRTSGILEKANVESELSSEQEYLASLKKSVAKFKAALPQDQLAQVDAFLPTESDFPGLLLTLENIARTANLELSSISVNESGQIGTSGSSATATTPDTAPAGTATALDVKTEDINLTVSGGTSYEAFKRFMTLVESSQRLFDVLSVSFSHTAETSDTETTSSPYTIVVRTYYVPDKTSS